MTQATATSTDWIASSATGRVIHLMSDQNAVAYKKASARGSSRRPGPYCGQSTRRAYVAPCRPLVEAQKEDWFSGLQFCEKCLAAVAAE